MNHKIHHFTKSERWGLIIWSIAILMISLSGNYFSNSQLDKRNRAILEQYFSELDSISSSRPAFPGTITSPHPFNPDTISALQLMKIGLPEELSERWVNFREHIESYKDSQDLAKIYGMDSSTLANLLPYIEFAKTDRSPLPNINEKQPSQIETETEKASDISASKPEFLKRKLDINQCTSKELEQLGFASYVAKRIVKYRNSAGSFYDEDELLKIYGIDTHQYLQVKGNLAVHLESLPKIDLNTASEETLKTLPGIGPAYASRIIKFRKRLGGFLDIDQLKEVYGIDEDLHEKLKPRLKVSSRVIEKIRINELSKDSLVRHPYISWEQAQKIVNFRKHHYPILSMKEILSLDPDWIKKIEPYMDFGVDSGS